jgi:TPR repeat protein
MTKSRKSSKRPKSVQADEFFVLAAKEEDKGNMRKAVRLYLAGAEAGDSGCQLNLGNLYDEGSGVRRDRDAALYWYKRAYRQGHASAAHNIGVTWRNEKRFTRAQEWFRKAVAMGDEESNLEIAKFYLSLKRNPIKAARYLKIVARSNRCTEAGVEEAKSILKKLC